MKGKVIILCGGWDGHDPVPISNRFKAFLESEDYETVIEENLDVLLDAERLKETDLLVPVWTQCTDPVTRDHFTNVSEAVGGGMGLAGNHGGMCDAFRNSVLWQFITGANWVSHPGGGTQQYKVSINSKTHPLTEGINDFEVTSEQYYLHVDPANEVLATTRFPTARWFHAANADVDIPQVWVRKWGHGRVYYNALGHKDVIFDIPEAWELMKRGLLWAAAGKKIARDKGYSSDDWKPVTDAKSMF